LTVAVHVACWPAVTVAGAQTTVVELVAFEMVSDVVRETGPLLLESPGYEAWTIALPAPAALTVMLQAPEESGHVFPPGKDTFPVPEPSENVILVPSIEYPLDTWTVQVVDDPRARVEGLQEKEEIVGDALLTMIVRGAEGLPLLNTSPEYVPVIVVGAVEDEV
jgi:hypothetical protein